MTKKKTSYSPQPKEPDEAAAAVIETTEAPAEFLSPIEVAPEPVIEEGVPLSSLPTGALFEFDGFVFQMQRLAGTDARIAQMEWSPDGKYRIPRWKRSVRGDTKVKPIS